MGRYRSATGRVLDEQGIVDGADAYYVAKGFTNESQLDTNIGNAIDNSTGLTADAKTLLKGLLRKLTRKAP